MCYNGGMKRHALALAAALCAALAGAQYQDYSRFGQTPAELRFYDEVTDVDLKKPSWLWHNPACDTPQEQLLHAARLEREGRRDDAVEAYDDLVHEWHATPEALTAQLAIARLESAAGNARQAYDADVYLLAHFAGRFELEPVLEDALAQADYLAGRDRDRTFRFHSGDALRLNYGRLIHFAPRWARVPELLQRIADLHLADGEYASAITVCDRLVTDWPNYKDLDAVVTLYCTACRRQADVWRNDLGRLRQLERLIAGAQTFRPDHPEAARFAAWQAEIHALRRDRAHANASFYDNPAAYSAEAAIRAYQAFLREYPDAPQADAVAKRVQALTAQTPRAHAPQSRAADPAPAKETP